MARSGLVSYGGDSEISDSEDERTPASPESSTVVVVPTNNLGIPFSQPQPLTTPPSLPIMRVEAAPTTALGLVDYTYIEEDDDRNDSKGAMEEDVDDELSEQVEENETLISYQGEETPSMEVAEDHCSIPLFLQIADAVLPPEPTTKCSKTLQSKIINLLQKKASSGVDMNTSLQLRKDLRNPSILEKLVNFCDVKEFDSNYPEHLYNPNEFTDDSKYDNLYLEQQKDYNAKKEKAKLNSIEFITATKKPPASATAKDKPEANKKARRTKWDVDTSSGVDSAGSRGTSPTGGRERPALLGNAPIGLQPRVLQVGAQARAQANQVSQELKKALK